MGELTKIVAVLGARAADLVRMVVGQGLRLAFAGIAVGVLGALAMTRIIASILYGVKPTDIVTFLTAALVSLIAVLLAALIPRVPRREWIRWLRYARDNHPDWNYSARSTSAGSIRVALQAGIEAAPSAVTSRHHHRRKHQRIPRRGLEQFRFQHPRRQMLPPIPRPRPAPPAAWRCRSRTPLHRPRSSQRAPNPNFPRPPRHRIRNHGENPRHRQPQRESRKDFEKQGVEAHIGGGIHDHRPHGSTDVTGCPGSVS